MPPDHVYCQATRCEIRGAQPSQSRSNTRLLSFECAFESCTWPWRIDQSVEERLPVASGQGEGLMARDGFARHIGKRGQAEIGQAAPLQLGCPLHHFLGAV